MKYAKELLPQKDYKIIKTSDLNSKSALIRKSLKNKSDSIDDIGDVRIDAICTYEREVLGLSTYLYGIFKIDHLMFIIKDRELHNDWYEGDDIPIIQEIKFEIDKEIFPLFLNMFDLHEKTFPYKKSNQKLNSETESFYGYCYIEHKPTLCNFWHFEFNVYSNEMKLIEKTDKKWKKDISSFLLKSFLKTHVYTKIPEKIDIPESIYKN